MEDYRFGRETIIKVVKEYQYYGGYIIKSSLEDYPHKEYLGENEYQINSCNNGRGVICNRDWCCLKIYNKSGKQMLLDKYPETILVRVLTKEPIFQTDLSETNHPCYAFGVITGDIKIVE
jgi:hypothetical protein